MGDYRIIQLLPADGWHALFAVADVEQFFNLHKYIFTRAELEPLIAWALVEWPNGLQRVVGLCRDGTYETGIVTEGCDFLGYFQDMPDDAFVRTELALAQEIADEEAAEKRKSTEGDN